MPDDEEVDLHEGMPVTNEAGEKLGTLAALLVAEDEEEAEFLLLKAGDADRLVPFEAVLGVGDGDLILDVPAEALGKFPQIKPDHDPTESEMDKAYEVFDENAEYEPDE
jgi:PRC-barrel domain